MMILLKGLLSKCVSVESSLSNEGIRVLFMGTWKRAPTGSTSRRTRRSRAGEEKQGFPCCQAPCDVCSSEEEELTPLDRLVLRLCRQNYGAWARVTISEPAVENSAFAPSTNDQVPKQTEHYCLPSEECGECTDTDPIMSRHVRAIKDSDNVSSFRSRKVTSEQNTLGPDGTDRRSQLLHWPQKSPENRFCLKWLELNNNTVQVIRDKAIQQVIVLKSSTGGRERHHATRLLAANLFIGLRDVRPPPFELLWCYLGSALLKSKSLAANPKLVCISFRLCALKAVSSFTFN